MNKTQFYKDILSAKNITEKAGDHLDKIKMYLDRGDLDGAVDESIRFEIVCEKIVNLARLMPLSTGIPYISEEIEENVIEYSKTEIDYLNNNRWFYIKIPGLLPKKEGGNPIYIRASVYTAMKKYFEKNPKIKIPDKSVIVFKHNYSKERSYREFRDHDNIELNSIVDLIALFILIDDNPMRLNHFYYSSIADEDSTEIYIVPNEDFAQFLACDFSLQEEVGKDGY